MNTANDKGRALENAVESIERLILDAAPGLRDNNRRIESRKIVIVNGVKHEIDIWVEIDAAPGYKSIFIFECKNLKDAVDKNEIIVFQRKIADVAAQRGYFIARSFTASAYAVAKADARVELLRVSGFSGGNAPEPLYMPHVDQVSRDGRIDIGFGARSSSTILPKVDMATAVLTIDGESQSLKEYTQKWIGEAARQRIRTMPGPSAQPGEYVGEFTDSREFEWGAATLAGMDVIKLMLSGSVKIRYSLIPIVSDFDVATRGRTITLATITSASGVNHPGIAGGSIL